MMMWREPWRTRWLFLSIAVNLLLLPIAGARLWTRPPPFTPGLPRTEMIIDRMVRDLPADDAERFRTTIEEHLGDIESARVRMLAARAAMSRAIGHSPFDPARVQAAMQTWQSSWHDWSEALDQAMLAALPVLSEDGRQKLAAGHRRRPQ
ncbi:MAG: periplasmic heavy metal sensor [Acetobacteraceae bacterium]|nr:periplasmic heavy metal sensor [Acetobacteraceae bacterium]